MGESRVAQSRALSGQSWMEKWQINVDRLPSAEIRRNMKTKIQDGSLDDWNFTSVWGPALKAVDV